MDWPPVESLLPTTFICVSHRLFILCIFYGTKIASQAREMPHTVLTQNTVSVEIDADFIFLLPFEARKSSRALGVTETRILLI